MYPLYYKGLRLSVTFQVKHLCVGDFASFAKIFAGFYFGKGIVYIRQFFVLSQRSSEPTALFRCNYELNAGVH